MDMRKNRILSLFLVLIVTAGMTVLPPPLTAAENTNEQTFPVKRNNISIAYCIDIAPFHYRDDSGKPAGILIDYWRKWSEKTGIEIEFHAAPWKETLELVKTGKVDAHAGLFYSKERDVYLLYSGPLSQTDTHLFYHKTLAGLSGAHDALPYRIGVISKDYVEGYLREKLPQAALVPFRSYDGMMAALKKGELKAFAADTLTALYHLQRNRLLKDFRYRGNRPLYRSDWFVAVQEGNDELIDLINQGMGLLTPKEKLKIERRWHSTRRVEDPDALIIAIDRNYPPYSLIGPDGEPVGFIVDLWRLWSISTGNKIQFRPSSWAETLIALSQGEADIHSGLFINEERSRWMKFSMPIHAIETALYFRAGEKNIVSLDSLKDMKVGAMAGSFQENYIKTRHPEINVISYTDGESLIFALIKGEIRAFIHEIPTVKADLGRLGLQGLLSREDKILFSNKVHAGVWKEKVELIEHINKGFRSIPIERLAELERRWYPHESDRFYRTVKIPELKLTPEEEAWLADQPVIRVASEPDYVPFDFRIDGKPAGYSIDYVKLLAERLGIRLEYVKDTRGNLLKKAEKREVDLLHSIFKVPRERERYLNFTQPYKEVLTAIVVRRDFEDITDLQDLAKRKVALAKGDSLVAILKESVPDAHQILYDDYQEVLKAVAFGQVNVAVTELPLAAYQIHSLFLTILKITAGFSNLGDRDQRYRLAVRKDWPLLIPILEKAMATLTSEELKQLDDKWMALPARVEAPVRLQVTEEEQQWLENNPVIRTAIDRSWAPVEFLDEEGNFQGISADYINRLEEMLGVKFEIARGLSWQESMAAFKRGELDLFTSLRRMPEREALFDFTDTYTSFPIAIFTGPEVPYIGSMKELNGRRVGVVKGYAIQELLATNHPAIELVTAGDAVEALEKLSRGEIDAYVGNILVTGYYIGQLGYTHIKVVGETPYRYKQSMGVRRDWPIFASILNKALDAIPATEHNAIYNRWIGVRYEHGFDYSLLWKVIAGALAILFIFLFWNRKLAGLNRQLLTSRSEAESARDEAETARRGAEAATQAKSDFLANMSHELRTPLNAIIGFSEILGDQTFGELNEKQIKYINNVLTSGRHLLQLISDILDLSKVEAGKMELEPSRVNIKGLLEDSLTMIKEKAMKHSLRLDLHIAEELMDLEIYADERKLKQIMFNLLSNAAKFTPDGGSIRLEAELILDFGSRVSELEEKEKSAIEISVTDTGIGIKPEDQERVFGEFEQLDSSYDKKHEGTGLGLALTRKLVGLHGGGIWVESKGEGKGSTFTFVIPIKALEREGEVSIEPEEPLPSRPDVDDSRPLVLVVEDDRQASELISLYLSEAGYGVAHAFDGEQAIQMARELRPYAITLDILLPKKDGWEVLAELKSLPEVKDIPVVIVSTVEKRPFGLNLGAVEYFVKPVNKDQLIEAVRKIEAMTVLVVDDEPQTVELLTDMLQAEGFTVLQAYGGRQGIDLAIEKHPDLIILDLMMPEVSGFDVVEQLRAHPEAMEIPIMIYTSKDLTAEDRQRLNSHVQAIASKSASGKEDLLQALEKLGRIRKGKG